MSEEFILNKKAEDILDEAVIAMMDLHDDFTSLPIVDYLCSTLILKLTGLLEQKFRAVIWTLASNHRDYRRDFLLNNTKFGEYSNYDSKQMAYKVLIKQINELSDEPFIVSHKTHLKNSKKIVLNAFMNTVIHTNMNQDYYDFKTNISITKQGNLTITPSESKTIALIPDKDLINLFEKLISMDRNRIAHNVDIVRPIKNNLHLLFTEENDTRNYFIKVFILLYIDKVLNQTYGHYKMLLNKNTFSL